MQVSRVHSVMEMKPEKWRGYKTFNAGNIVYPREKLNLVKGPRDYLMRVVDLACPLGKGQRALVVAPPRTGKTVILKENRSILGPEPP